MDKNYWHSIRNSLLVGSKSASYNGLFQKKSTPPPTDGILEILAGGGVEDSENPGGRGVDLKKVFCRGYFDR